MKNTAIVCLVVLNAILLAGFFGRASGTSPASSGVAFAQQQQQPQRPTRPGDYLMIPGELTAGSAAVVYVIDTTNGWLSAFAYDDANKRLDAMPGRIELAQVFAGNPNPDGGASGTRRPGGRGY